ncbi:MAG: SMC-Scp complex subunit ScpB [Bacteroidota bacterium]
MEDAFRSPLRRTIEAIVFASDEPVTASALAKLHAHVFGDPASKEDVESEVATLNREYQDAGRAFRIRSWAEGYRMATVQELAPVLHAHFQRTDSKRLSRSLMETLAIIAYRQPVTKPEVDHVRGVNSDYALRKLLDADFVTILGRSDAVGRPLVYGTTDAFLERFGIRALDDLPKPREIEELLNDPAFNTERAALLSADGLADTSEQAPRPGGMPPFAVADGIVSESDDA